MVGTVVLTFMCHLESSQHGVLPDQVQDVVDWVD